MGIIEKARKVLTSWYNEDEAQEKMERTQNMEQRAIRVVSNTESIIRSYRASTRIMADRR